VGRHRHPPVNGKAAPTKERFTPPNPEPTSLGYPTEDHRENSRRRSRETGLFSPRLGDKPPLLKQEENRPQKRPLGKNPGKKRIL